MNARAPLARFQLIMRELNNRKRVSIAQLTELLECSNRTVERDLAFLRDQLGLPIESSTGSGGGHFLSEPVALCPVCAGKRGRAK